MGEGTSQASRGRRRRTRGQDKDRRRHLSVVPPEVEDAFWRVAARHHQEALVVFLTRYFLRPDQAVAARLSDEGLVVPGFERPIPIDPADRGLLSSWLARRRRPHSPQVVRDVLGKLQREVVADLGTRDLPEGAAPIDWRELVDLGAVSLRRLAREHHAEACGFEEAVYRELIHHETADPLDVLRFLSRPARTLLATAARSLVAEIVCREERT